MKWHLGDLEQAMEQNRVPGVGRKALRELGDRLGEIRHEALAAEFVALQWASWHTWILAHKALGQFCWMLDKVTMAGQQILTNGLDQCLRHVLLFLFPHLVLVDHVGTDRGQPWILPLHLMVLKYLGPLILQCPPVPPETCTCCRKMTDRFVCICIVLFPPPPIEGISSACTFRRGVGLYWGGQLQHTGCMWEISSWGLSEGGFCSDKTEKTREVQSVLQSVSSERMQWCKVPLGQVIVAVAPRSLSPVWEASDLREGEPQSLVPALGFGLEGVWFPAAAFLWFSLFPSPDSASAHLDWAAIHQMELEEKNVAQRHEDEVSVYSRERAGTHISWDWREGAKANSSEVLSNKIVQLTA